MKIQLPKEVQEIIYALENSGYEAYAVGGCIRDSILQKKPADWDITTSARPEQLKELFHKTIDTGIQHGTVTVILNHQGFEVTTYRIDGKYEDGRHPTEVTFTSRLLEDLKRRDFTMNAMAYNDKSGLVDAFDGISDLQNGIVRCVGEPEKRFTEDALRMLRAVRFAAQLGFRIEPETKAQIQKLAPALKKVSAERIRTEFEKMLLSDHPQWMREVGTLGLATVFFPEWEAMVQTRQNTPHHQYTVAEHTIHVLENVPATRNLRLAALLHDIAKPLSKTTDADGRDHFKGHPEKGEEMAKKFLRRLKYDNETIHYVSRLVRYHDERPELTERAVRRKIAAIGTDIFPDLFLLKRADTLAQSEYRRKEKLDALEQFEKLYDRVMQQEDCLTVRDLDISGQEIMALGVSQGPEVGRILEILLEKVLDTPEWNQKEILLQMVRKQMETGNV